MNNPQLEALHPILETIERMSRGVSPFEAPGIPQRERRATLDSQEMTRLRVELRKELIKLRNELGESLAERECYLLLFPVVVCIDELVQTRYTGVGQEWPLLQQEFFKVDQGGELFYQTVDQVLDGGAHSPIVYEVFFFCLAVGFKGKLAGDEERIAGYIRRLGSRFTVTPFRVDEQEGVASGTVKPVFSRWWLYLAAALAIALFYVVLITATSEPELPDLAPAAQEKAAAVPPGDQTLEDALRVSRGQDRVAPAPRSCPAATPAVQPAQRIAAAEGEEVPADEIEPDEWEDGDDVDGDDVDGDVVDERAGRADREEAAAPADTTPAAAVVPATVSGPEEASEAPAPPIPDGELPGSPTCRAKESYFPGAT